jgi:DNA replication and repair protein RecF
MINWLRLEDFRNYKTKQITFSSSVNLILGQNGTGKSSLLEAVYCLAYGRSFRVSERDLMINNLGNRFTILAEIMHDGVVYLLKIQKERACRPVYFINKKRVARFSELAACFPLLFVNTDVHRLLIYSPDHRRKLLNWIMFHVEPSFEKKWKDYCQCLRQRNTMIKNKVISEEINQWEMLMGELGDELSNKRISLIKSITSELNFKWEKLGFNSKLDMHYDRGWAKDLSLSEALKNNRKKDVERGYTLIGFQRGDFSITENGVDIKERLSEGERKTLSYCVQAASAKVLEDMKGQKVVYAVDDLGAELDEKNQKQVFEMFALEEKQVILTGIRLSESIMSKGIKAHILQRKNISLACD